MKSPRVDVSGIRKQQIVEAAVAIINEQGLQHLSLSEIEKKAGMSRGQLTYYFPAKEDILLAVFDHLIRVMKQRAEAAHGEGGQFPLPPPSWERATLLLGKMLTEPPSMPELGSLQYTFLAQVGHREDFRSRLANIYEEWRQFIAEDVAADLTRQPGPPVSPRTFATLLQAVVHGLAIQRAADPTAFDAQEMLELVLDVLGSYLKRDGACVRPAGRPCRAISEVKND
jgi:AcrR family transcriptional regulator